jgi:adenylate cyclase
MAMNAQGEGTKRRARIRARAVRLGISGIVLLFFVLHGVGLLTWGILTQVENFLYDARVRLTMPGTIDPRIVIVDIDERTLAVEGQWPLPRDRLARMVDELFDHYGAQVVGFDIVFAEQDKTSALIEHLVAKMPPDAMADGAVIRQLHGYLQRHKPDQVFARSLQDREVILGYVFKGELQAGEKAEMGSLPQPTVVNGSLDPRLMVQAKGYTGNLEIFQSKVPSGGFFDNPLIDVDGSMRRTVLLQSYNGHVYESLSLALVRQSLNAKRRPLTVSPASQGFSRLTIGERDVLTDPDLSVLVPYRGRQGAFPYVSATDVMHRKVPIDTLFNAIVLVGTTAPGLLDLRTTPVSNRYPGVEVHANVISGLLDGRFKRYPANIGLIELSMLVGIGLLLALLLPVVSPLWGGVLVVALVLGSMLVNLLIWLFADLVLPMATPLFYALGVTLLQMTYSFLVESRNKRRLSKLFGQYVPPELVEEMDQSQEDISLKGISRDMTVLFSDVRGFTKIAEKMEPAELTELMNAFLTPITRVIHEHRGTVDKYMGDAVMAFWGAPMTDDQHAVHALEAAMSMVETLRDLQPQFRERGWPVIEVGIGLNSGTMNVGNMGSEFRMAYTVLGDAVNLGSRLEALTRQYEVNIIVSEFTVERAQGFVYRELDRVRVKGKIKPVTIYEPLCKAERLRSDQREELGRHETALGFYRLQNWEQAEQGFRHLAQTYPKHLYSMYLDRISHFRANPPPADWDGVFTYTSK